MDEISERQRKEENEDLAEHPAAFHPAVQLSTHSFGRQQSSEGRSAVGGIMANGAIIENLIKMLKKLPASSQLRRPPHCPAPNPIWKCGNAKPGGSSNDAVSSGVNTAEVVNQASWKGSSLSELSSFSSNQTTKSSRITESERKVQLWQLFSRQSRERCTFRFGSAGADGFREYHRKEKMRSERQTGADSCRAKRKHCVGLPFLEM